MAYSRVFADDFNHNQGSDPFIDTVYPKIDSSSGHWQGSTVSYLNGINPASQCIANDLGNYGRITKTGTWATV